MTLHSPLRPKLAMLCGIALATGIFAFRAQADDFDRKTILTVDQPIQVVDTVLEPGTYVFKLASAVNSRNIVQIFNSDQTHLIETVMATPNYRVQRTGTSRFVFWETPPGTARALRAWFYPGDNDGQEFRYPKEPKVIQVTETIVSAPLVAKTETVKQEETAVVQTPAPAPAPEVSQEIPPAPERVEIAQNNPPPAPEAQPAPAPAPSEEKVPEQLPRTASNYPLIGLGGFLSLSLYTLLRLKRSA